MKKKSFLRLIAVFTMLLLIGVMAGTVFGQEPGESPALEPTAEPAGGISAMAQITNSLNYQGYLADSGGAPLTGTHTLAFSLYDAASAGTRVWGPESHTVQVNKGLFAVALGSQAGLETADFKNMLFLEVTVDGAVLTTRQPLRPSAYAFSLVPGAVIQGAPSGTAPFYGLKVINSHYGPQDSGLFAQGFKYAIYANQFGDIPGDDVAIYADDFVEAQGYRSREPSYWWTPGMSGVPAANLTMAPSLTGTALLSSSSTGSNDFYLPVALPSMLYGQEVMVKELTLYYFTSNSGSSISSVRLEKFIDAATSTTLINNGAVTLNSTTPTSVTLTTSGSYTLTTTSGPLNLRLGLNFGNTAHIIYVGGIRLKLEHYE